MLFRVLEVIPRRFRHRTLHSSRVQIKNLSVMSSFTPKITGKPGSLEYLCCISKTACDILTPMVRQFYQAIETNKNCSSSNSSSSSSSNSSLVTEKQDDSIFTIADGLVQHLLIDHLFGGENEGENTNPYFANIVGEESCHVIIKKGGDTSGSGNGNGNSSGSGNGNSSGSGNGNSSGSGNGNSSGSGNGNGSVYQVEDILIPTEFHEIIDVTLMKIQQLSTLISSSSSSSGSGSDSGSTDTDTDTENCYQNLTIFIDPIDGTREFSTSKGEQCTILIGYANKHGQPVAGIIYRPIPIPIPTISTTTNTLTYACGAKSEGYFISDLDVDATSDASSGINSSTATATTTNKYKHSTNGFLTTNGNISPFINTLIKNMNFMRVPSGGVGNKVLMLIEGNGTCYIQDRGVSRWDTCGPQAVLEAQGGTLRKLTAFIEEGININTDSSSSSSSSSSSGSSSSGSDPSNQSYTYLKSPAGTNRDFIPGLANLTKYNCQPHINTAATATATAATSSVCDTNTSSSSSSSSSSVYGKATNMSDVKEYSNLCGLFAVGSANHTKETLLYYHRYIVETSIDNPLVYD